VGLVKDHLRGMIARQVRERGIVVWFDPNQHYTVCVHEVAPPGTQVELYDRSVFDLRHRIDPLLDLNAEHPPKLLIYVPTSHIQVDDALIELTATGVVMRPGLSSPSLNTRLPVVAKAALRSSVEKQDLAEIEKQLEANKLTLEDVDNLGGRGGQAAGVISAIFKTTNPADVALAFLADENYEPEIAKRQATSEVTSLLGQAFGAELSATSDYSELQSTLARHVLLTEFVSSLHGPVPTQLASLKVAEAAGARDACLGLVRAWRNRRDLRESYAVHADRLERELQLPKLGLNLEQIEECETFAAIEVLLQTSVEDRASVVAAWAPEQHTSLHGLVEKRLQNFWSVWPERYPAIQQRWQIDQTAICLLRAAESIEQGLKSLAGGAEAVLELYGTGGDGQEPWYLLDTHHRHLERRVENVDVRDDQESLQKLVALARRRYRAVGEALSERYLRSLQESSFQAPGFRRQIETYAAHVAPALREGKTAYLLVDALRYEMARELAQSIPPDYEVTLELALGTVPTITPIGMAACLPGTEAGIRVVPVAPGKLALEIGGTGLKTREDRVRWLSEHVTLASSGEPATVVETKLQMLLGSSRKLLTDIKRADLILVTSQEIDEVAESDNVALARRIMDDTLVQLQRAIRKLADLGCSTIVVTSDHGHLFADELDTDTKIDAPGGQTTFLDRRVWIGTGGATNASVLRTSLAALGVGEVFDVAVPWGFGGFKAAGGTSAYFHGGMSPQEMAIPVMVVRSKVDATTPASDLRWDLKLGSRKITTRFVSVQVMGTPAGLFAPILPRVRVEIRAGDQTISEAVSATYGFNEGTRDVELTLDPETGSVQTNTVTLMISSGPSRGIASVHLLDSATGMELASLADIGVDIAL